MVNDVYNVTVPRKIIKYFYRFITMTFIFVFLGIHLLFF